VYHNISLAGRPKTQNVLDIGYTT